tara:strand:- start:1840 stop:2439 length:600 start_codon:yes stop_codon:yes gene_type:complete
MQFNSSSNGNGVAVSDSKYPKGVFVDLITLTKVDNTESKYNDCNLFVEGDSGGPYPKKFYLGGNHVKDGDTMIDWGTSKKGVKGGSWKVAHFIEKTLGKKSNDIVLNDDGTIHEDELADMLGRKVFILQYESSGPRSRDTWYFFAGEDEGKDALLDKWKSMSPPQSYKHKPSNDVMSEEWAKGQKQMANQSADLPDFLK